MKICLISTSKYLGKGYKSKKILNYKIQTPFENGIKHYCTWIKENWKNLEKYTEFLIF